MATLLSFNLCNFVSTYFDHFLLGSPFIVMPPHPGPLSSASPWLLLFSCLVSVHVTVAVSRGDLCRPSQSLQVPKCTDAHF